MIPYGQKLIEVRNRSLSWSKINRKLIQSLFDRANRFPSCTDFYLEFAAGIEALQVRPISSERAPT